MSAIPAWAVLLMCGMSLLSIWLSARLDRASWRRLEEAQALYEAAEDLNEASLQEKEQK